MPLDGRTYLKADYPELDTRAMLTFGSNTAVTRQTLAVACRIVPGGPMLIAHAKTASAAYYTSTDDGTTWTPQTAPVAFGTSWRVGYANGVWFILRGDSHSASIYTSTDGISWSTRTVPLWRWGAVGYINGQYVLVSSSNTTYAYLARSTDLITWTQVIPPTQGFGGSTASFTPDKISLTNHPTMGLVWSLSWASNAYVLSTLDAVNFTSRLFRYQTRSTEGILTGRHIEVTELGDFIATFPDSGVYYRGSNPGQMFFAETGVGNSLLQHMYANIMSAPADTAVVNTVSEDFGRTTKAVGLTATGHTCATPTRLIHCTSGGVIQTVDIDTTRFSAVANTYNFQDYNVPLFIKAR